MSKCIYKTSCRGSGISTYRVAYYDGDTKYDGLVCDKCLNTLKKRTMKNKACLKYQELGKTKWEQYGFRNLEK